MEEPPWKAVSVRCYAGRRYAERPLAFVWEGRELSVEAVLSEWWEPSGPVFRVHTLQGLILLRYVEPEGRWLA
ncbi:MAG: hypothetical protein ACP5SI_11645, partial [Chloroflexia bacterium]